MANSQQSSPLDIAKETLRLLAARRLLPTPDNYRVVYQEIVGGEAGVEAFPKATLSSLTSALPNDSPAHIRLIRDLEQFIRQQDWPGYKDRLIQYVSGLLNSQQLNWGGMIAGVLAGLDAPSSEDFSRARKLESLDHVLWSSSANPDLLYTRLQGLLKSWGGERLTALEASVVSTPVAEGKPLPGSVPDPIAAAAVAAVVPSPSADQDIQERLKASIVSLLNAIAMTQSSELPTMAAEAVTLGRMVRDAETSPSLVACLRQLQDFAHRLECSAGDQTELKAGLLGLLRLLVENVEDIVSDDGVLHGQIAIVRSIVDQPMTIQTIDDASLRLQDVICKQAELNKDLAESRISMKLLFADFVDQLTHMIASTSGYGGKMGEHAKKIASSESIAELTDVIAEIVNETKVMQHSAEHSRGVMLNAQVRVKEAEEKIEALEQELQRTSDLVRYDHLTGVLNRRGMEEMLAKEVSRAVRHQAPLCVGILDIDNFKKLNDSLGHKAGDDALVHLATLCRDTLRPQDIVARYGGEEFVIILPDTMLEDGVAVLVRLQRELTKRIFLHEAHKVLITFSAGITEWQEDDSQSSVIRRADEAMYQAKQTGKNKVVTK